MTRLLAAQQVSGAANLEVFHGDGHTGPQIGVGGHCRQAIVGGLGERLVSRVEEVGIATLTGTADTPAQLV